MDLFCVLLAQTFLTPYFAVLFSYTLHTHSHTHTHTHTQQCVHLWLIGNLDTHVHSIIAGFLVNLNKLTFFVFVLFSFLTLWKMQNWSLAFGSSLDKTNIWNNQTICERHLLPLITLMDMQMQRLAKIVGITIDMIGHHRTFCFTYIVWYYQCYDGKWWKLVAHTHKCKKMIF